MNSVNIAELKNNLSRYLEQVKAGKEFIIRDRSLAVARLSPISGAESPDDELLRLAAQGKLKLGDGAIDQDYWKLRIPRLRSSKSKNVLQKLIDEERDED